MASAEETRRPLKKRPYAALAVILLEGGEGEQPQGSLNRLQAALKNHVADDAHQTRALEGVRTLRDANSLRSGRAHGGFKARESRIKAQTGLDIRFYPDATWPDTWNQLRARLTEALSAIASAVRDPR